MNYWTEMSIDYANQKSYLDDLFQVYPTIPEGMREIDSNHWALIEEAFNKQNNLQLLDNVLKLKLFPIKDSYIAYLKKDPNSIQRNPKTVDRICGRLYEMGLDKIYEKCSEPKETNRQIGPMFNNWIKKKSLGILPVNLDEFLSTKDNAILGGSDAEKMKFAKEQLNYHRNKGLDFVGRFNGKYVIGEAKFLSSDGGSQNNQIYDVNSDVKSNEVKAEKILILDYDSRTLNYSEMCEKYSVSHSDFNILSVLVLREFLYQL